MLNQSMGIITLEGLEFFSYHGYHAEERKLGNKYSVDISVGANVEKAASTDKLQYTVNYSKIYEMINQVMSKPTSLLEKMADKIIAGTFILYPDIEFVEVTVSKFNPPLGGICHKAKVTLKKDRIDKK